MMEEMQLLEQEEEDLAERLKKVCTPYGDEIESKLNESGEILFLMGRLYATKAEATTGIEQKLNFIKATALFHGAQIRFEMFSKDTARVINAIRQMERYLLDSCKRELPGSKTLTEISQNVKRKFITLRKREDMDLKRLEIISEDLTEDDAQKKRLEKIDLVQYLMEKNTVNFKHLMSYTAQKCLEILGKPLCHFAIVGLGSLARQEITLYSDFEHVIILDEGMQDSPEYDTIKEYFRWFAVVFEIIIIGLGETIIRSVGVKSINDLYASDKTKNWFYDMFTPSGVSIDGMMPHACKTPLGRQELTGKKEHTVELVRSVSQMSFLLTSEEDLKNGYNLKDVLRQSCFVFGCEALFQYFKQQANNIVLYEDKKKGMDAMYGLDTMRLFTTNNVNDLVRGRTNVVMGESHVDSKSSHYRPLSALLTYLDRMNRSNSPSTFEMISKWIRPELQHVTLWAFAVACELRMKIYAYGKGTRQRVTIPNLSYFVGQHCVHNLIKQVAELSHSLHNPNSVMHLPDNALPFGDEIPTLISMEHYKEASGLLRKRIQLVKTGYFDSSTHAYKAAAEEELIYSHLTLAMCCARMALSASRNEQKKLYKEVKELFNSCQGHSDEYRFAGILFRMYATQGQNFDAFKVVEKYLNKVGDAIFTDIPMSCFFVGKIIPNSFPDSSSAISYCNKALMKHKGIHSQLAFKYGRALAMIKAGMKDGRKELHDLTVDVVENGITDIRKFNVLCFFDEVFLKQTGNMWWDDALATLETGKMLLESRLQIHNAADCTSTLLGLVSTSCYFVNCILEKDFGKKYELFVKGIRSCGNSKNFLVRNEQYVCYVNVSTLDMPLSLLSQSDFDTFSLLLYSDELESNGLDNFDSHANVMSQLFILLGLYQKKMTGWEVYNLAGGIICLLEEFHSVLCHPLFANVLSLICMKVDSAAEIHRNRLVNACGQPISLNRNKSVDIAWRNFPPQYCRSLKENVRIFERMKSLKYKFSDFFCEMLSKLHLSSESITRKMYNKAVKNWCNGDFLKCVHRFWKIINSKKGDFQVRTRSVIMFFHSVVLVLGMKCFYSQGKLYKKDFETKWPLVAS